MGTELVRCGVKEVDSDPLWGAYANIHQPGSVIQERLPFFTSYDMTHMTLKILRILPQVMPTIQLTSNIRGLLQTQSLQTVCGDSNNTVPMQSAAV